jgi:holliday junction DNA helicase RuvA
VIGRITGRVIAEDEDGATVVDVEGIGYELFMPLGTLGRTAADESGRSTFFIHTHVREEALTLFGFASAADRLAFRTLIGVSNVGPKTAIQVLSALPSFELARAIAQKELGKLVSIPGIGKKTAERLLLELRDKLPVVEAAAPGKDGAPGTLGTLGTPGTSMPIGRNGDLLASALTRMGYRPAEAERAVIGLGARVDDAPLADLLREALAFLAK